MWWTVLIFNPYLGLLSVACLPLEQASSVVVLAKLGRVSGGSWLEIWVSVDAFLVLSGAAYFCFVW